MLKIVILSCAFGLALGLPEEYGVPLRQQVDSFQPEQLQPEQPSQLEVQNQLLSTSFPNEKEIVNDEQPLYPSAPLPPPRIPADRYGLPGEENVALKQQQDINEVNLNQVNLDQNTQFNQAAFESQDKQNNLRLDNLNTVQVSQQRNQYVQPLLQTPHALTQGVIHHQQFAAVKTQPLIPLRFKTEYNVVHPAVHTPVVQPAVHTPIVHPVVQTRVVHPVVHTPIVHPVVQTRVVHPVVQTHVVHPVVHTPVVYPVVHTPFAPVLRTPLLKVESPVRYIVVVQKHQAPGRADVATASLLSQNLHRDDYNVNSGLQTGGVRPEKPIVLPINQNFHHDSQSGSISSSFFSKDVGAEAFANSGHRQASNNVGYKTNDEANAEGGGISTHFTTHSSYGLPEL